MRKFVNDIKKTLIEIEESTKNWNYKLNASDYCIEDLGCPHKQPRLPKGYSAVYIFVYEKENNYDFLKIGKANIKSATRFNSQHYGFNAPSTLAKSICSDKEFIKIGINENNCKDWMLNNLYRINILIKTNCLKNDRATTELIESVLHYKFRPRYEGNI